MMAGWIHVQVLMYMYTQKYGIHCLLYPLLVHVHVQVGDTGVQCSISTLVYSAVLAHWCIVQY